MGRRRPRLERSIPLHPAPARRLTIMRDGENVGVLSKDEITAQKVTTLMIGHEIREDKNRGRS